MTTFRGVFTSLALGLLLVGCTRTSVGSSSSMTISIPNPNILHGQNKAERVGALDDTQVMVLIINVTGADIPTPVFYSWNANSSANVGTTAPSMVTLAVPQGSSRVVQVLVGYAGSSGLDLYYGSATADLQAATASVTVQVNNLSSSTGMEGRIAGRYIDATGVGPTGALNVYLTPKGSTLPPVLVQQSEIIGGWFDIFGMTDVGFTYKTADGTSILGDNARLSVDTTNPLYPVNSETSMDYVPAAYRNNMGSDIPKQEILLFGYFGPGAAATNNVCYDNSSGYIANAWSDAAHTQQISWISSGMPLASLQTSMSAGNLAGSKALTCSGTAFSDYLKIQRDHLVEGNSSVPFRGPYAKYTTGGYINLVANGANLEVDWTYVPGVFGGPNSITGSQVFYLANPGSQNFQADDGFDCPNLAAKGFSYLPPSVGIGTTSAIIPGMTTASNVEVIVCPYRTDGTKTRYFKSAADGYPTPFIGIAPYHFMLTMGVPTNGQIVTPLELGVPQNATSSLSLQVVDSQNRAVAVGAGTSVTLTTGYPMITFDGASSTSQSFALDAMGKATFPLHVQNNEMTTTLSYSYSGSLSGQPASGSLFLPVGVVSTEPPNIQISTVMVPASGTTIGACVPVEYMLYGGATGTLNTSTVPITFTPSSSSGTFYAAPDCTGTAASSVTIAAGKSIIYLYFKPSVGGGSQMVNMTGSPVNASSTSMTLWSSNYVYVP